MKRIAFYGKGGIGKSTIVTNIAAVYAERGKKVMVVGCDPKADCTRNLIDEEIPTVLDVMRERGVVKGYEEIDVSEVVYEGRMGILCVECGGPEPGVGCAGRGVIVATDLLRRIGAYEGVDVVLYDVLGDVVCGGFAMPLREGLASEVYIVTSADFLAIYAANNICKGIVRYASRGGSLLGGIIYNVRGSFENAQAVSKFASLIGSRVIGSIPNSKIISESEIASMTVVEYAPSSDIAQIFRKLAEDVYGNQNAVVPRPLSKEALKEIAMNSRRSTREHPQSTTSPT